jgi:hypothetical protein
MMGYKNCSIKNMVLGLKVKENSPMPDCVACTEAKQYTMPFNICVVRETVAGELTHIDLWGKYEIMSINEHQYYIVLVDNMSCMITVDFLKEKMRQ